jgi:hypothetical protein
MASALRADGEAPAAREQYKQFLDFWKEADPDILILRQAGPKPPTLTTWF